MLVEALALVFICGGLAMWLEVSFIVAAMVLGATIANLAHHHTRPFHEIENIEWPFMIIFFVLAGASLDLSVLPTIGFAGIAFILARIAGKYMGTVLGAVMTSYPLSVAHWLGIALLPQAGVAIGLGLLTANHYPQQKEIILSVVIGTTVLFEIFGPISTRLALRKMNRNSDAIPPR